MILLQLVHSTAVDTSVVFPHRLGPPYKRALRTLAVEFLKQIIQNDGKRNMYLSYYIIHNALRSYLRCFAFLSTYFTQASNNALRSWSTLRRYPQCFALLLTMLCAADLLTLRSWSTLRRYPQCFAQLIHLLCAADQLTLRRYPQCFALLLTMPQCFAQLINLLCAAHLLLRMLYVNKSVSN
jgi:hypothetical protein